MVLLSSDVTERVYDFITEDDEGRTCEAIPESACKEAPRNFVLFGIQAVIVVLTALALIAAGICRAFPEAGDMVAN